MIRISRIGLLSPNNHALIFPASPTSTHAQAPPASARTTADCPLPPLPHVLAVPGNYRTLALPRSHVQVVARQITCICIDTGNLLIMGMRITTNKNDVLKLLILIVPDRS